jgi:hypothetical protein
VVELSGEQKGSIQSIYAVSSSLFISHQYAGRWIGARLSVFSSILTAFPGGEFRSYDLHLCPPKGQTGVMTTGMHSYVRAEPSPHLSGPRPPLCILTTFGIPLPLTGLTAQSQADLKPSLTKVAACGDDERGKVKESYVVSNISFDLLLPSHGPLVAKSRPS